MCEAIYSKEVIVALLNKGKEGENKIKDIRNSLDSEDLLGFNSVLESARIVVSRKKAFAANKGCSFPSYN